MKTAPIDFERPFWLAGQRVTGIDEAGRGPIAGPLVVAGVVLPIDFDVAGINDSKALSTHAREAHYAKIIAYAVAYQIEIVTPEVIDRLNIYQATRQAMTTIAQTLEAAAVLTDAMPLPGCDKPWQSIIKGDTLSLSIAAASILAKVTRDRLMEDYDRIYPQYGFAQHKGYPTAAHLEALERYGACPIHRQSYGPVAALRQMQLDI